jgi:Acetyltransferase (GNAT) domain
MDSVVEKTEVVTEAKSLFQEDWWLHEASLGRIERVEVNWDGIVIGTLSFTRTRRLLTKLGMPIYTRTLGPVLSLPPSSQVRREINTRRVIGELLAKLPEHDFFYQVIEPTDNRAFAFHLSGCLIGAQFTFRIPAGTDLTQLFHKIEPSTRRLIQGARTKLTIEPHFNLERFLAMIPLDHSPEQSRHDTRALRGLFEAAQQRDRVIILSAVNTSGIDVGCVILVWGGGVLYYWLPHRDRERAGGGMNAFLLWESITYALGRRLDFDFDSFASAGTGRFLSNFGAPPVARSIITRRSKLGVTRDFIRGMMNKHYSVNGMRPDPECPISFHNSRISKRLSQLSGSG